MYKLTGLNGSVEIDDRTIIVKSRSGGESKTPVVLAAASVLGVAVWTKVGEGAFNIRYLPPVLPNTDAQPAEILSIRFRAPAKEMWDAMASAIMEVVRSSQPGASTSAVGKVIEDAIPAALQSVGGWLSQTLGLNTPKPPESGR